jgi:hypothetical protein
MTDETQADKVEIQNLPKEDTTRRISQLEAAVISLAESVKKMVAHETEDVAVKRLDKKADVALKEAVQRVQDFRKLKVGDLCHYHLREDKDFNEIQVPCKAVEYKVRNPQGIKLNNVLLTGNLVVPQCTANTFNEMDEAALENEKALYSNRGRSRFLAEYKG